MTKRLYRSRNDYRIGGVCGGIAEYFSEDGFVIDPIWIRLAWGLLTLGTGVFGLFYLFAWVIIPRAPK